MKTDDGEVYVFNGAPRGSGGGAQGSFHFATLRDPQPKIGGNFGGAHSGVGDLAGGLENPANEVIVGGFRFDNFTEASQNNVTSLHIINAQTERTLQSIPDPDQAPGSGFGIGITPMGDLNGDGFLDIAASSYLYNGTVAGQGRAYIMKSNDTPLPAPQGSAPAPAPTPTQALVAGPGPRRCFRASARTRSPEPLARTVYAGPSRATGSSASRERTSSTASRAPTASTRVRATTGWSAGRVTTA